MVKKKTPIALLNCANFSHCLLPEGHALINQEHELWLKVGDGLMEVTRGDNNRYLQHTRGGTSNNPTILVRSGEKNHDSLGQFTQEK